MSDPLVPRLRLALGASAVLDTEEATTGGRRHFLARGRQDAPDLAPTRRVVLHAAPPDGPHEGALARRADQLLVLTHPAVAAPLATGSFEGRAWVVEPIPPGVPLGRRIADRGTLALREVTTILREMARALAAMHRRDLTHGALGAEVVMIDPRGTVLTGLGRAIDASPADDLRALGTVAWQMLVGELPTGADRPLRSYRPSAPLEMEQLVHGLLGRGGAPVPTRAEEVLSVLDHFPPLAPEAIADFLDGVGAGSKAGRHRGHGVGRLLGGIGVMLGRLRGR